MHLWAQPLSLAFPFHLLLHDFVASPTDLLIVSFVSQFGCLVPLLTLISFLCHQGDEWKT